MVDGGPYTGHGHAIEGITVVGSDRPPRARCGGPAICGLCSVDAERIRRQHAPVPSEAEAYWEPPCPCENEHPEPRPGVAVIHIIDSNSAANATVLCAGCLVLFAESWADQVQTGDREAYRWEIRPVTPGPLDVEESDGPAPG